MPVEPRPVLKLIKVQDAGIKDGSTVLVRVDYNVPMKDGAVADDTRIRESRKTVKYLLDKKCKVVLIAHFGRPKGKVDPKYTLKPVVSPVEKIMGARVHFGEDCVGEAAAKAIAGAKAGEIVLLENLRYHAEEEKNDEKFAKELSRNGQYFVQEAFGALHRAHASTGAIAKFMSGSIGFLVQKELEYLEKVMSNPARPFVAVIGGAKVSDKIGVLYSLIDRVDSILIGGAMAYTFLSAQNNNTGKSLVEPEKIDEAKKIILKAFKNNVELLLPSDHVVVKEIKEGAKKESTQSMAIADDWIGVDIGPRTEMMFAERIKAAKTLFWNGPLGIFETPDFAGGTQAVARAVSEATRSGAVSVLGGGDTVSALKVSGIKPEQVSHCSTGGGASLEFMEGKTLPGIEALSKN
ncbi:MAG: phosphoglycerate kinase [Elusimicrobia bacterium CG08_land_8_20_14_0_20_51_18]|nr:MAG: phosphoglycerate kinase [Elusimicrobia bacterium CG08_land_8_20_14_0_20_51_18]